MVFIDVKPQCWSNGGDLVDTNIQVTNIREFVNFNNEDFYALGLAYIHGNSGPAEYLLERNAGVWDTAAEVRSIISSGVFYDEKLVIAGYPGFVGDWVDSIGITAFENDSFMALGSVDAPVLKMRVIDNELYASGFFTEVNGDTNIKYLAKYDGNSWQPVHDVEIGTGSIDDFIYYGDELYIAGNFKIKGTDIIDIAVYRNGSWQKVGGGLTGPLTGVSDLEVYKGELYAGGLIIKASGNPGHTLIKWDGTSWSEPGYGLRDHGGGSSLASKVNDLEVHDDYLYVVGEFYSFGDENSTPLESVARWDGESWCSFQGSNDVFYGQAVSMGFYQDTMFIYGGSDSINGEANNRFLKCGDFDNYIANCVTDSSSVGFDPVPGEGKVSVFPNPLIGEKLNIKVSDKSSVYSVKIYNVTGDIVFHEMRPTNLRLHDLSKGVYFLKITLDSGKTFDRKLVKQ
jgi:hypothetical protein